jgi:nucleoside-diphosphate-sugar epimerase
MRVLIVGCGYVGLPLGAELVRQGHEVFGMRRTDGGSGELVKAGIKPVVGDVTNPEELRKLPGPFDWVVNCVSSSKGGVEEYREVYLQGTRNLLEWLAASPPKKFVYTSSTSVYGQTNGEAVSESCLTEPASETARILVETEKVLLEAAREKNFPAAILRVAGIYGPGRGHLFQQYLRGEAKMEGKGERLINMVHLDDVAGAIIAALRDAKAGAVYNVADDEPVTQLDFFRWLSDELGRGMPPFASEGDGKNRKRGLTNKKVQNRRLKMELGYQFKYPDFREGYSAEIQRLEREGLLDGGPS